MKEKQRKEDKLVREGFFIILVFILYLQVTRKIENKTSIFAV